MDSSKSLFLLFSVLLLLICSEVAAAGQEKMAAKFGNQGTGYGDAGCGCMHGCCRCCTKDAKNGNQGTGYGDQMCRCLHGCCRCCSSADEVPDTEVEDNIKN